MSIKKKIIQYAKSSPPLHLLFLHAKKARARYMERKYSQDELIAKIYKKVVGAELNLEQPLRFTEKIQWLKLNYCSPDLAQYSDKLAVRKYIEEKGYKSHLIELLAVYDTPDDIVLDELPEKFVLKTTHSSGWNLICTNKTEWRKKWFWWKKILSFWLNDDYSKYYQENHYKTIKPRIICEKFMGDNQQGLNDYKFLCFHGKVKLVQIDVGRYSNHLQNFYDENFNFIPVYYGYDNYPNHAELKPKRFEEMKKISEDLAKDFLHVRVDLFEWNDKIYFGELTFFDGSGYYKTNPEEFDYKKGEWLKLPDKEQRYTSEI